MYVCTASASQSIGIDTAKAASELSAIRNVLGMV